MKQTSNKHHALAYYCLLAFFKLAGMAHAQHPAPMTTLIPLSAGLTLPITLSSGIRAGSTKPGSPITGITTQRIFLDRHTYLNSGAHLDGILVASTTASKNPMQPATLILRFQTLRYNHRQIPVTVNALAIANFTDVDDSKAPANGSTDRGNPNPASWTTRQIGGDEVVRSGWIGEVVNSTTHRVGSADFYGVYADPLPGKPATSAPLAMGPFSTTVHGTYGLNDGTQLHSEAGTITLTAPGKLLLRRDDAMLLQVVSSP